MDKKLILGTVQFGMDYGINNKRGRPPVEEVYDILDCAREKGIDMIDTSYAYGESEKVIGSYDARSKKDFKIISKLPKTNKKTFDVFNESISRLKTSCLYGYLIHHFDFYMEKMDIWDDLQILKNEKKCEKVGFSLYHPRELDILFNKDIQIDIVQFPYSIFDQRFSPYFDELNRRNVEIHVRSVFLQGLVFRKPESLDIGFDKIKSKLKRLNDIAENTGISISSLCLNFAYVNKKIDYIVIGIDDKRNLEENIDDLKCSGKIDSVYDDLISLNEEDEKIILPYNWKK
jgi:aryl-alcohol dehydrogenase-like predicted oxidoreductase